MTAHFFHLDAGRCPIPPPTEVSRAVRPKPELCLMSSSSWKEEKAIRMTSLKSERKLTSRRCKSIESTATKKVWAKNQCATSTTIAKAQNWRIAPADKTEITPRIELYETTFNVLDVPARLNPSAIRCFTESVTDVLPTASAFIRTGKPVNLWGEKKRPGTYKVEHILRPHEDDDDG